MTELESCNARAPAGLTAELIAATLRARALARAQCTIGEIIASLVIDENLSETDARTVVSSLGVTLAHEQHAGRASLRVYLWDLANGAAEARKVTATVVSLAEMLGRQHLGYTSQGLDERIRKQVEQVERDAAKHKGPSLVGGGRAA